MCYMHLMRFAMWEEVSPQIDKLEIIISSVCKNIFQSQSHKLQHCHVSKHLLYAQ